MLGLVLFLYILTGLIIPRFFSGLPEYLQISKVGASLWGFNQWKPWGIRKMSPWIFFSFVITILFYKNEKKISKVFNGIAEVIFSKVSLQILISCLFIGLFYLFRSNFLNNDGKHFQGIFERRIPLMGAYVTLDELWELYIHSKFWYFVNNQWNWSVYFSYQVLSVIAGGVMIYVLLCFAKKVMNKNGLGFFLLFLSGGFMQLFFGDIENYTLTSVWVLLYFYLSARFLERKVSLVYPSTVLAIALTFHLLAGFLLPSLAYLYWHSLKRGEKKNILISGLAFAIVIGLTLWFFDQNPWPIEVLWRKSFASGRGGNFEQLLVTPNLTYYFEQFNLLLLLFPGVILFIPSILYKRIKLDAYNIHLIIAVVFMLVLQFGWKAQLGVYQDWDLYAIGAIPMSILLWRNLVNNKEINNKNLILLSAGLIFSLHSYAWILGNHIFLKLPK